MMYDIAGQDIDDVVGEILGQDALVTGQDDLLDVLGAALQAKTPQAAAMLKRYIQRRKMSNSQVLTARSPRTSGVRPIGFNQIGIAAGVTATVTTQPQEVFKGYRLVVPETIAPFFTIDNILVGNKSQFPAATPLPAEGFIPQAADVDLDLETVNPAINLSLVVTNISGIAQNFRAMMTGKQVDV